MVRWGRDRKRKHRGSSTSSDGIDWAASKPFAARASHHDQRILEQDFRVQLLILDRRHHAPEYEIDAALAEVAVLRLNRGSLHQVDTRRGYYREGKSCWLIDELKVEGW